MYIVVVGMVYIYIYVLIRMLILQIANCQKQKPIKIIINNFQLNEVTKINIFLVLLLHVNATRSIIHILKLIVVNFQQCI